MENKIISQAKKNLRDYKIIEKFTAGVVLTGNEIKSLRINRASIDKSYAFFQQNELYIKDFHISIYKYSHPTSSTGKDKKEGIKRNKKLLLKKREIKRLKN